MAQEIFGAFYEARNEEQAKKMSAYMRNLFPFLGLPKPVTKELSKAFLKLRKKDKEIDWDFIFECYGKSEREFHYLGLNYLAGVKKHLVLEDISKLEKLITTNSWWDSVDTVDGLVGHLVLKHPELKETVITDWMKSENIWLVRVAIDFQLSFKEKTDTEFLSRAILHNCGSDEFFINKAIGWSLREYAKTNPDWVMDFLDEHESKLSSLSLREASKHLYKDN